MPDYPELATSKDDYQKVKLSSEKAIKNSLVHLRGKSRLPKTLASGVSMSKKPENYFDLDKQSDYGNIDINP